MKLLKAFIKLVGIYAILAIILHYLPETARTILTWVGAILIFIGLLISFYEDEK